MSGRLIVLVLISVCPAVLFCTCSSEGAEPPHGGVPDLEIEITDPYWQQLFPAHDPGPRCGFATACDVARNRIVLYGGLVGYYPDVTYFNDTWEFDGTDWTEIHTAHRPSKGRSGASLCYVKPWKKMILFGGGSVEGGGVTDETWSYDGIDWTKLEPATIPPTRTSATMEFDENLGKVLLFGGQTHTGAHYGDCWLFDGQDWELLGLCGGGEARPGVPLGRSMAGMVWNPVSKRMVLFGGYWPFNNYWNDTWEFYDKQFHKVTTATSAPDRAYHGMTFHELSGKCLFFGGIYRPLGVLTKCNDLWEYDGIDWREIGVRNAPPPRNYVSVDYFPKSQSVYLYGGSGNVDSDYLQDTWKYSTVASSPALGSTAILILVSLFTIAFALLTPRFLAQRRRTRTRPENNHSPFPIAKLEQATLTPEKLPL